MILQKFLRRCFFLSFGVVASPLPLAAQSPPDTFTRTISTAGESLTVRFSLHPIRSSNFGVLVQQPGGGFLTHSADVSRTYLGTVDERPGAIACGLLHEDGTLWARISLEDGKTWTTTGGTASQSGSDFTPAWPNTVVGPGGAGSTTYAAEVGIDSTYNHFIACGGTPDAVVEKCEFAVLSTNMIYLRDAAILHQIGKIVIRADQASDPYVPDGGDTAALLPHVRTLWNASSPMGSTHDLAGVMHSGANGGLAYVGTVGTSSRYSANDSDSGGDFWVVWRHEIGHNWSSSHFEGGGNPEGSTIMSNNSLSRFSSPELKKIIAHRNTKTSILGNLGNYSFPIPPRANQDTATFLRDTPVVIDPIANDSDSNGEALSLLSFDSTSNLGATLTLSSGTGPGGRDQILYAPPSDLAAGTDWFKYLVRDSSGMRALGFVMVRPRGEILMPTDHWTLDDSSGNTAVNRVRPAKNGTHQNGVAINQPGANAVTRKGAYFDGIDDQTSIPAPGYNSNTLTFTAWIKRDGTQTTNAPLLHTRAGSSVAGFHFGTANELRYTWDSGGYTWNSGLVVPNNTWCLAAMCVSPTATTLYLRTPGGMQSATNNTSQSAEAFNGNLYLGYDPISSTRHFKGWLDDVRAFPATLAATDIESLYQQAVTPPAITLTAPVSGAALSPLGVNFAAQVSSFGNLVDQVDFVESDLSLATVTTPPYQATVPAVTPGTRTFTARASYGDWNYETDSPPVTCTVLPPPLPAVTVTASLSASKLGPIPGAFHFQRDHPIGEITIPFSLSGSAIAGTDYQAIPTSITIPDGSLAQSIVVNPIAAAPDGISESLVLTLGSGSGHTPGTPSSATLVIDDHITSIANGAWNTGNTWIDAAPAPTTGTQNSGNGYAIAHTVTSNNTSSNSQAFVAASLRVMPGGILDLARLHSATNQNVSYNLPTTTIEGGGEVRFRCSTGTSTHTVAAAMAFSGSTTLRLNGGGYGNDAKLTGPISGSGSIAVLSDTSGSSAIRQVSINSANNPYAGNWTVERVGSGNGNASLRAGAANALGTGTVTVGNRAELVGDTTSGLNSLSSIILTGASSVLRVNQPWNNPAASLSLTGGSPLVRLGGAASSIGSLSGSTGTIEGSSASSQITVNQSHEAIYSGTLGGNLSFIKSGPAALTLSGTLDTSLKLGQSQGKLSLGGQPSTIGSLILTGGTLELTMPADGSPPLAITGNLVRSAGSIRIMLPSNPLSYLTPYQIVAYQGTLTGEPPVSFTAPVNATIDYGTGSDSFISVIFHDLVDLAIDHSPSQGGTSAGDGSYDRGSITTITATPADGWQFTGWSGDGIDDPTETSTTVTMNESKSIRANFTRIQHVLTVNATTGGSATGGGSYDQGSIQPITATPDPGWNFQNWTGNGITSPNSHDTTVFVSAPSTVTAHFISDYDLWAQSHGLVGADADKNADPDRDGMNNLLEMAYDFLPNDANSRLRMDITSSPEGDLSLVINKVIPACSYFLEWTTGLNTPWEGSIEIEVTAAAIDHVLPPPLQPGRCFYRLRCVFNEP